MPCCTSNSVPCGVAPLCTCGDAGQRQRQQLHITASGESAESAGEEERERERERERELLEALDAHLLGIMQAVRLHYLIQREGGWDATATWEDVLSLGEQQRLGMVRSPSPSWAALGPTSRCAPAQRGF